MNKIDTVSVLMEHRTSNNVSGRVSIMSGTYRVEPRVGAPHLMGTWRWMKGAWC